jgi:hypothetical protein
MNRVRTPRGRKKADALITTGLTTAVSAAADTASRVGGELRTQVAELDIPGRVAELDIPGRVTELDIPGRVHEVRRELAGRIDPGPRRGSRRRVLWIGLSVTAICAAVWAALARRPRELEPLSPSAPPAEPSTQTSGEPAARSMHTSNSSTPTGSK